MSGIIDPKTGQPIAQLAAAPQGQFTPPIDPQTGQPAVNPSTGQPFTAEEFARLQEEARKKVDLACQMLTQVIPDTLIILGPGGIICAVGDMFRLKKLCELGAKDLDYRGEAMFRQAGWFRRPQPGQAAQAPAISPEDHDKFVEDVETALKAQADQTQPVAEPAATVE